MNITGLESSKGDGERKKKAQAIIQRCAACIFFFGNPAETECETSRKISFSGFN